MSPPDKLRFTALDDGVRVAIETGHLGVVATLSLEETKRACEALLKVYAQALCLRSGRGRRGSAARLRIATSCLQEPC